jgi:myo-inositol catabolism protein IolH
LRYIVNPPGSAARIHQHLDIGQGEVDWDVFFRTLAEVGFDGIATVCVFAWEERAQDSSRVNLARVNEYVGKYFGG